MQADDKKALSDYRLTQARQCVASARLLYDAGDVKGAANRSYYGIFHAIRAVLALDAKDFSKHSAVINYFRQYYIKPGKLDVELSDMITDAFQIRTDCDYNDYYVAEADEVLEQVQNAEEFLRIISNFLEQ